MDYPAAYQKANNEPARGAFGPYAFDGWLVMLDAAKRALATGAQPGTPEFRTALRDAIVTTKDLVGTHAIYNFKPGYTAGVDKRAQVLVKLVGGKWKLSSMCACPKSGTGFPSRSNILARTPAREGADAQ